MLVRMVVLGTSGGEGEQGAEEGEHDNESMSVFFTK